MNGFGARIYVEDGEYEVWVGPASDLLKNEVINAFPAGFGHTLDEAVVDALRELEAVVAALKGPLDVVKQIDKAAGWA